METLKKEIIAFGKKLSEKELIVATEGNISCRIDDNIIIVTSSGVNKGEMEPKDLVVLELQGKSTDKTIRPSSEIKMHLEVYHQRPDVCAIIHAHSPFVNTLNLAGISLDKPYFAETVLLLGSVPTAPYARPSTEQVPESISPYIRESDIIVLSRHGSLTVGKTLKEAYHKLELLERTASILWHALTLGHVSPLPEEEVRELMKVRRSLYYLDYPIMPFDNNSGS